MMNKNLIPSAVTAALLLTTCVLPAAADTGTDLSSLPSPGNPMAEVSAVTAPIPTMMTGYPGGAYRSAAERLRELGCDASAIRSIWEHVGPTLDEKLKNGQLSSQQLALYAIPNSREELMGRYAAFYRANPSQSLSAVVTHVNTGLDVPFYSHILPASDPDSSLVLVNKTYALSSKYVPDLETLGSRYGSGSLRPVAARAFRQMVDAARKDGISLKSVSAYRSYSSQKSIYEKNLQSASQKVVDTFSARPGHSEHQTGLGVDINVARTKAHFENTKEYAWLQAHCAEYGFILRYPEGKDAITGFRFEPWHYRYVGVEAATLCMSQGLTFEEYTAQRSGGQYRVPDLLWEGKALALSPLLLDGRYYVPAQAFAQAVGGSTLVLEDWPAIARKSHTVLLSTGRHLTHNDLWTRLDAPSITLDDTIYLALPDLCRLLGLKAGAVSDTFTITITDAE